MVVKSLFCRAGIETQTCGQRVGRRGGMNWEGSTNTCTTVCETRWWVRAAVLLQRELCPELCDDLEGGMGVGKAQQEGIYVYLRLPCWLRGVRICLQCRRLGFSLGWEDLVVGMAAHFSTLDWRFHEQGAWGAPVHGVRHSRSDWAAAAAAYVCL